MINFLSFYLFLKQGVLAQDSSDSSVTPVKGVDLFLVQDVSLSYENDLPILQSEIPHIVTYLATHNEHSRLGMGTFVDKPIAPFGYSSDYCYELTFPLLNVEYDAEDEAGYLVDPEGNEFSLPETLANLDTYSGRDWKENQLGALLHTLLSPTTGINDGGDNERITIIALATDSGFHEQGQHDEDLLKTPGIYAESPDAWCTTEDYPTIDDVQAALIANNSKLLLMVPSQMKAYYTKFLERIGSDLGFVVELENRSEFIAKAIQKGIEALTHTERNFGIAGSLTYETLVDEFSHRKEEARLNSKDPAAPPSLTPVHAPQKEGALRKPNGPIIDPVSRVQSWFNQVVPSNFSPDLPDCGDVIFEIVLVEDASDTFEVHHKDIITQVPDLFSDILERYRGSRFGLTAFVDKPIHPFGYPEAGDYCSSMRVGLTDKVNDFSNSLSSLVIRSGNDWKEAQLHALMHTAYTLTAKWTDTQVKNNKRVIKVAILTTDAGYHVAGDSDLPENNADRVQDCEGEDYPSVQQVAEALHGQSIFPFFLVTENVKTEYLDLLSNLHMNGALQVIGGGDGSDPKTIRELVVSGLNSICNYDGVRSTKKDALSSALTTTHNTNEGGYEVELNQRLKNLEDLLKIH